jgi:hypothetical protein
MSQSTLTAQYEIRTLNFGVEIITVHYYNHSELINTLYENYSKVLTIKRSGTYSNQCSLNG